MVYNLYISADSALGNPVSLSKPVDVRMRQINGGNSVTYQKLEDMVDRMEKPLGVPGMPIDVKFAKAASTVHFDRAAYASGRICIKADSKGVKLNGNRVKPGLPTYVPPAMIHKLTVGKVNMYLATVQAAESETSPVTPPPLPLSAASPLPHRLPNRFLNKLDAHWY